MMVQEPRLRCVRDWKYLRQERRGPAILPVALLEATNIMISL